ncbi:hypothetical protein [Streptomyces sp. NBC_00454]|uniref:hypothetical protein n=1 Tax=Streptomyces sp. NBC_00454 TaxID=2975747 RepID=UPI0030E306F8
MHKTTATLNPGHPTQTPAARRVAMWVTALTVAMLPVAFLFGALAGMATQENPQTVAVVTACWWASWTATPLLVVASRLPLHRTVWARAGYWAGWAAPLPPATTILLTLTL